MKPFKEVNFAHGYREALQASDENYRILEANDLEAETNNTLVGRYLDHPIADGISVYIIIKENKNSVRIRRSTGLGDDYSIPAWGFETTIPKKLALSFIHKREALNKLFNKK